jgi:type 2 lantibiotic biosynthesis protein LanM
MQTRIATLSSEDMEQQVGFIRATFRLRDIKNKPRPIETKHLSLEDSPRSSNLEFLQAAGNVANDIARQAIVASNGSASWLGFEYVLEAERAVIQPLGYNLHSGSAGIALFLAAWERVSGESNYRDLALGAIQQMRNSLRQDHKMIQMMSQRMSLGAAIGQGAIIYCLTRIHTLLNEPTLLEDAQLVANCITMDRIALDTKFDVMDGAAGAILGLLTLYNCTGNQDLLIKATACGHRLLEGRTVSGTGERVWTTLNQGSLLTGFSHGAAGIAYALLRLYEACGNGLFYEAAVEAIAYENRHFAPEQQNWIDLLRTTEQEMVFGNTWCHGAPGIGLARLGTLHLLDNDQIKQDILAALQVTRKMFTENLDTVCCGNLGRSELFITAANKLNDVTWHEMAVRQASSALFRYQQSGAFCMPYSLGTGYSGEAQGQPLQYDHPAKSQRPGGFYAE